MIIFALLPIVFYFASKNNLLCRRLFEGSPSVLIQNGKIEKTLTSEKFTVNYFLEKLRTKMFSILKM